MVFLNEEKKEQSASISMDVKDKGKNIKMIDLKE